MSLRKNLFTGLRSNLFIHYPINYNETKVYFSGNFIERDEGAYPYIDQLLLEGIATHT